MEGNFTGVREAQYDVDPGTWLSKHTHSHTLSLGCHSIKLSFDITHTSWLVLV